MKTPYGEKGLGSIIDLPNFLSCNVMIISCSEVLGTYHRIKLKNIGYLTGKNDTYSFVSDIQKGLAIWHGNGLYKSRILDSVLMILVQKRNRTSPYFKLYSTSLRCCGTKCTHSGVPGLKGEALFLNSQVFHSLSQP